MIVILYILAWFLPLIYGHGYVESLTLDGKEVQSYLPFQDPYQKPPPKRITRAFLNNSPIEDVTSDGVACNSLANGLTAAAEPSQYSEDVTAGSDVVFSWSKWPDSHKGPILTYMAYCKGDCSTFSSTTKNAWIKIDEAGFDNGVWAAETIAKTGKWTSKIPKSLAAGQYLIRHEIIALHSAHEKNGAQLYMQCFQVNLKSSGNIIPTGVSFPGAYKADDPGLFINIYYPKVTNYTIPGPPLFDGSVVAQNDDAQADEKVSSSLPKISASRKTASGAPPQSKGSVRKAPVTDDGDATPTADSGSTPYSVSFSQPRETVIVSGVNRLFPCLRNFFVLGLLTVACTVLLVS